MRVVVAPTSFKGSASAWEAAAALEAGVRWADPTAQVVAVPIADGGEGTARVLAGAGADRRWVPTVDAYGRPRQGEWFYRDGVAFVDAAAGAGFVPEGDRPEGVFGEDASSYGTGLLVRAVLGDPRVEEVWLGLGGTGCSDGGAGFLEALGWRFWDAGGRPLRGLNARRLTAVARVDAAPWPAGKRLVALYDVAVPLLGARGAAFMFGPQKGVRAVEALEAALEAWSLRLAAMGADANAPGAGAAGGMGLAVLALGQRLLPGAEAVLDRLQVERHLRAADWCLTGEGRLDAQTLQGKAIFALAGRAQRLGVPVVAVVGRRELDDDIVYRSGVTGVYPLHGAPVDPKRALEDAGDHLRRAAYHVTQWMRTCRGGVPPQGWGGEGGPRAASAVETD